MLTGRRWPRTADEAAWLCTAVMLEGVEGSPPTHRVWVEDSACDAQSRALLDEIIEQMMPDRDRRRWYSLQAYEACCRLCARIEHAEGRYEPPTPPPATQPQQLSLFGGDL